jgi:hypothetical protein
MGRISREGYGGTIEGHPTHIVALDVSWFTRAVEKQARSCKTRIDSESERNVLKSSSNPDQHIEGFFLFYPASDSTADGGFVIFRNAYK